MVCYLPLNSLVYTCRFIQSGAHEHHLVVLLLNSLFFIRLATGSFLIWNTPCSKLSGVRSFLLLNSSQLPYMEVSLGSLFTKCKTLQYPK